jgi:hypothetical protein
MAYILVVILSLATYYTPEGFKTLDMESSRMFKKKLHDLHFRQQVLSANIESLHKRRDDDNSVELQHADSPRKEHIPSRNIATFRAPLRNRDEVDDQQNTTAAGSSADNHILSPTVGLQNFLQEFIVAQEQSISAARRLLEHQRQLDR